MILVGTISGLTLGWAIFSMNKNVQRAIFSTGALGVFMIEFIAYDKYFTILPENEVGMFVVFLTFSIISFAIFLINAFKMLKNQETKYKINTWEILFGNNEVFEHYYALKKKEIDELLNTTHDIEKITKDLKENNITRSLLKQKEDSLNDIQIKLDNIIKMKQNISIPHEYIFPVDKRFLQYIPKFIHTIANFHHQLNQYTSDFINTIENNNLDKKQIIESYLTGLSMFTGEHLFNWNNIRIHFRQQSSTNQQYIKYLAFEEDNIEYTDNMSALPNNEGIIKECINSKRSLVKSANISLHISGSNDHKWKNYITMVFDKFIYQNYPVLTMTISVQHDVEHQEFLYFLSYIRVEEIIQTNLEQVNKKINIVNSLMEVSS